MANASNGWSQPSGATTPINPVNVAQATTTRDKTNFPMNQTILRTPRFGEILPFFVFDAVPNDHVQNSSSYKLNSYTLASPLFNSLRRHKHYISVPFSCILPNTWSKVFVNPKKGDDVPEDVFPRLDYQKLIASLIQLLRSSNLQSSYYMQVLALYLLASEARLPQTLGLQPFLSDDENGTTAILVQNHLQKLYSAISAIGLSPNISIQIGDSYKDVGTFDLTKINGMYGLRDFFDVLQNLGYEAIVGDISDSEYSSIRSVVDPLLESVLPSYFTSVPLNVSRLIAYQQGISQLFTNDNVDDIFTAELWNQNSTSLVNAALQGLKTFTYNGVPILYDPYSYKYNEDILSVLPVSGNNSSLVIGCVSYFMNLLLVAHPLRYGDYFMSAKTQPLAVGDVTTSPNAQGATSSLDTVLALVKTRFLNLVNSVRNSLKSYSQAVYGVTPDDALPEPKLLNHSIEVIDPTVNVNTAEDQGTQNANVVAAGTENSDFLSYFSQHAVVIGLESFDFIQVYTTAVDKAAFYADRFDMYIPQLQNIGDQPIYLKEFGFDTDEPTDIYGWQPNYSEYKQLINHAQCGFAVNALPSWFIELVPPANVMRQINSLVIRHRPAEFDILYKSLSGYANSYFHFIESVNNNVNASRPMEFVSGILMNS